MLSQIYQYTKRKKRGFKRRMDRLIRKFTMHNRMITEAYYRERSPELGVFRRGLTLGLLCLASVTGRLIPIGPPLPNAGTIPTGFSSTGRNPALTGA